MKMQQRSRVRALIFTTAVLLIVLSWAQAQTRVMPEAGPLPTTIQPATGTPAASSVAPAMSAATVTSTTTTAKPAQPSGEVRIGSGDLVEVSVFGAPEFQKVEARVSSQGEISLPILGAVRISGLNTEQAEKVVADQLSKRQLFNDPHVTIFVKEYATQGVSVLGEVLKPGVYPVLGERQLFDAISLAGGLTPKAGSVVSVTHRTENAQPIQVPISNDPEKSAASNIKVYPGDTIFVPRAGIVYVVGDVKTPGGFVIDNSSHMTVLKAIALAQGANSTASLNNAKLVRKTATGQQEQQLELKKIFTGKSPDVPLQADDIVFVPNSAPKSATKRGLEAILQTATGVAIYHPY